MTTLIITFLLNYLRAEHALPPLRPDQYLTAQAEIRCRTISSLSHDGWIGQNNTLPDGWLALGENLAFNYDIVNAIIGMENSPTHHANNNGPYTHTGSAECDGRYGKTIVVLFGIKS